MEEGFHEGGDGNFKFNVPNLLFKVPWTTPPQNLLLSLVPDLHLLPKFLHYQRTIFNGPRIDLLKVHQVQNEALNPESMASLPFITVPVTGWNPMVCAFPRMCWVRLTGYWEPVWTYTHSGPAKGGRPRGYCHREVRQERQQTNQQRH